MINLLPPQEKQVLKLIETQKKVLIISAYFLFFLACLMLILFLLNYYIWLKTTWLENIVLAKNQELETYQFQDFRDTTLKVNQNLAMIQAFQQEEVVITPFLEEIFDLAPQGIFFTELAFRKDNRLVDPVRKNFSNGVEDTQTKKVTKQIFANINLAGKASTREILYSFKKVLERQKNFQAVYFSPQSWTESHNAHFSVNFEVLYPVGEF